jgi:hypothetical protein
MQAGLLMILRDQVGPASTFRRQAIRARARDGCPPDRTWIMVAIGTGTEGRGTRVVVSRLRLNWATAEGWNPGLADDACFAAPDPEDFFIGELDGALGATASCELRCEFRVPPFLHRAKGFARARYGLAYGIIWNAAITHAGPRVIGLDGVLAPQQNYTKFGFELAYANVRQWVSLIVADLSTGKWAVPGAYSDNGDNCQMQLRRRVRTH